MSKWDERVSKHAAVSTLGLLTTALDDVNIDAKLAPSSIEDVERIRDVQRYISVVISNADPQLISPAILNNLTGPLQNTLNEITAFKTNGNIGHLANANAHIDALIPHLHQMPYFSPGDQLEGLREAVISFRRSAGQYLSAIERDRDSLAAEVADLKARVVDMTNEVSQQKARLDSAITEYQQQFSTAENARREEFNRLQSDFSAEARSSQDSQQISFNDALADVKEKVRSAVEMHKGSFDLFMTKNKADASEHLVALSKFRDKAEELLHVIGSTGMAGEFQKAATSAKRAVWLWQGLTVASIGGLIGFAILAYLSTVEGAINWAQIGSRLFVAVTFGVLAAFSVRQADRYHDAELRNRRYQLELSSIDPYLAGLPVEKRDEVKIQLAERLFGAAGLSSSGRSEQKGGGTTLDLLKVALETLQQMAKKAP